MPVVWIARLIGVPITQRPSGSDIFDALKSEERLARLPPERSIQDRQG